MDTKRRTILASLAGLLAGCTAPRTESATAEREDGTLHHVSTIDALACGHFADETAIDDLLEAGDFGLGTVNGLDGELAVVDGDAYAVRGDGTAVSLEGETRTPFAAVTRFEPDLSLELEGVESFEDLSDTLTPQLPRTDHFYAIRIDGPFEFVRTRSVDGQVEPYPTLEDVLENETVFELEAVDGTMPTFYIPEQFRGIHPPGYHAHFITADRDGGGHVYDFRGESLSVELERLGTVDLELAERVVESYPPC